MQWQVRSLFLTSASHEFVWGDRNYSLTCRYLYGHLSRLSIFSRYSLYRLKPQSIRAWFSSTVVFDDHMSPTLTCYHWPSPWPYLLPLHQLWSRTWKTSNEFKILFQKPGDVFIQTQESVRGLATFDPEALMDRQHFRNRFRSNLSKWGLCRRSKHKMGNRKESKTYVGRSDRSNSIHLIPKSSGFLRIFIMIISIFHKVYKNQVLSTNESWRRTKSCFSRSPRHRPLLLVILMAASVNEIRKILDKKVIILWKICFSCYLQVLT